MFQQPQTTDASSNEGNYMFIDNRHLKMKAYKY